jgi:hypothetical protein
MKNRSFFAAMALLAFATSASAADTVKEIDLKGLKAVPPMSRADKPTEIKNEEQLSKAFPQKELVEQIKKDVDFDKQKLLLFAWSGSGKDKISFDAGKDEVTFTYQRGLTRDLRAHFHLFAIPKDAKWSMSKGK